MDFTYMEMDVSNIILGFTSTSGITCYTKRAWIRVAGQTS